MNDQMNSKKPDHCLNCNLLLKEADKYCPNCGQKALPDHLTVKYFIHEFLNNYFSFDSKFLNTVKQLIIKPGFLTIEFIAGRRIRYINPIQLFIFSSFLYFLVNSFMFLKEDYGKNDLVRFNDRNKNVLSDSVEIQQIDSLFIVQNGEEIDTIDNSYVGEFLKKSQDFNAMDTESQNEKISRNISYSVFLLMPLFALYLGWFFKRKKKHYLENIVFSLHFHAFYYVAGVLFLLLDKLITGDVDSLMLLTIVCIYLLIAIKRFYSFSWISSVIRFIGLIILYGLTVSIFLVISILISVFI